MVATLAPGRALFPNHHPSLPNKTIFSINPCLVVSEDGMVDVLTKENLAETRQ
ncbi:hypothetical protein [Hymenobacter psoromatis]|uniref:hypothetical protein n=1 Tax=Hymenobacter psoromatis TaxID=1484116 RepID=UPI001CC0897E|nr:hypothetical protein [Hymenobacter psoromatis]